MKFKLEIDLGPKPNAKTLAGQLQQVAWIFWTATEQLKPQVYGIDDPRTMATGGKWEVFEREPSGPVAVLAEFMDDVDAVGIAKVRKEWPDLSLTYDKAKKIVGV